MPFFLSFFGGTGIIVGIVGGLRDSLSSILKGLSGYWSDKIRRKKPFVATGYAISAASKMFFPIAGTWEQVTLINVCERTGKGIRDAPRDAIIAESSEGKKGKGFGIHRAMDTAGAILGAVIAFLLILIFKPHTGGLESMQLIFFAAAIIAFFSLIPLIFVKEKPLKAPSKYKIGFRNLPRNYYFILLIVALFALGNFTIFFMILFAGSFFMGELGILIPLLLYILFNITYTVFSIPSGVLADKYGNGKILSYGYGFFSLTCVIFIFCQSISLLLIFGFAILGLAFAFIDTVQRAYISDLVPQEIRGTALGTFHMVIGLAALPAGLLAGFMYDQINPIAPFIYGAIIGLISMSLLLIYIKKLKSAKSV